MTLLNAKIPLRPHVRVILTVAPPGAVLWPLIVRSTILPALIYGANARKAS